MAKNPNNEKWFFGRISRDDAEKQLRDKGAHQGLYLLRESMTQSQNYALSICHMGNIHHYSIERQADGKVMIQDGKKFAGPVELVEHHKKNLDGFLTKPQVACERPPGRSAMAWPHVSMSDLELLLLNKAQELGLNGFKFENAFGPEREQLIKKVAKDLHQQQCWFHGKITRDDADRVMAQSGHKDGKFLVRERDYSGVSYALSLSFRNLTKHYKVGRAREGRSGKDGHKLAIEDGPRFDNLMDMVAHYHNKTDGLLCKLVEPCMRPGWKKPTLRVEQNLNQSPAYGVLPDQRFAESPTTDGHPAVSRTHSYEQNRGPLPQVPDGAEAQRLDPRSAFMRDLTKRMMDPHCMINQGMLDVVIDTEDPPDDNSGPSGHGASHSFAEGDDRQQIYDSIPDYETINRHDLQLLEEIGSGNFGCVQRGIYKKRVKVAVKTLKTDEIPNAEEEIMREARLMANLRHRNIVRLIGVCKMSSIFMVLELAECGQLNKFLKKRPDLPIKQIIELMFQVAEGMRYLEQKNFVHRDLAARNVLLVNESHAKISDFGMSKALGLGNTYYKAEAAGKWPLKWYAPECIFYFKFDSKSDVWSYGVTLWEALSFGTKPYKGLKGQEILEKIEHGGRLDMPRNCPPGVYELMLRCWEYEKEDRPNFGDIVTTLRKYK